MKLPYSANKIEPAPQETLISVASNYKCFTRNNWIESKIMVYNGLYMSKLGEPCIVIVYTDKTSKLIGYELLIPYEDLNSFNSVVEILAELDSDFFGDF